MYMRFDIACINNLISNLCLCSQGTYWMELYVYIISIRITYIYRGFMASEKMDVLYRGNIVNSHIYS